MSKKRKSDGMFGFLTSTGIGAIFAGKSAAQIAQILATVGKTVGGGMATGVLLISAAPIVIEKTAEIITDLLDD